MQFGRLRHPMLVTTGIFEYAHWLEEIAPGFIFTVILTEAEKDCRDQLSGLSYRNLGHRWLAQTVGCPQPLLARHMRFFTSRR
jgi:hypothetical protein